MKKSTVFLSVLMIAFLSSCGKYGSNEALTGPKIDAYLNAYKGLRQNAPSLLNSANSGDIVKQKEGFAGFESELKKNNLSYPEFVKLNAKIGAIYSLISAENFMGDMDKMKTSGLGEMDEGMKQIQQQIEDPNVPEAAKVELRKSLEEMKAAKSKINSEYGNNKYWADLVMDKTKSITNQFTSKEDVELVKTYKDKITEAYAGTPPANFTVNEAGLN